MSARVFGPHHVRMGSAVAVEHRYIADIAAGIAADGLEIGG